ncbi:TniB family NTP-binding protein [Sphingomonas sp. S2-65]|uniref:TniB family NTP-binding protein n=1 Tax=Sphingomonas sp. S2-65 TaxID=2903960 RepID=UPI001F3F19BA|nr:TniB family NTP-binding protein [Sphingomonas sp. S2-65]UYY57999.1 TniB family NTP-binding protein [Sphingomonas sp. S2-65]
MISPKHNQLFSEAELQPASGFPVPSSSRERLAALKGWNEVLESIYVNNPNHAPVLRALDEIVSLGRPGSCYAVRNSAASFAGKSAAADEYARVIARRKTFPAEARPVVRVELEQACTSRRFWTSILDAYDDGYTSKKDEVALRRSAYDAFEEHGTVLLIIDEVQHAGYRSSGNSAATDVIKRFINDGRVGLGLFGNEEAGKILPSNNQLSHRLRPPCDIKPLRLDDTASQATFSKFLGKYDQQLTGKKLFAETSNLTDPRVMACLMSISSGYLGRVVALLREAARHAFLRSAARIEVCDLSHATSTWAVEQKLAASDPFRFGVVKANG